MAKLLLVEDDNNLREIYQARLSAEGYDIVSAQNGEEALVVAKKHHPDLIISDVMMPRISGFEMLDILRNTDELRDTKIIMLTALGQAEDKARSDKLGADKYLVKSQVTLEDIVNCARDLLEGTATTPAAPAAVAEPEATLPSMPSETAVPTPLPALPVDNTMSDTSATPTPVSSATATPADSSVPSVPEEAPASTPSPTSFVSVSDPDPLMPPPAATPTQEAPETLVTPTTSSTQLFATSAPQTASDPIPTTDSVQTVTPSPAVAAPDDIPNTAATAVIPDASSAAEASSASAQTLASEEAAIASQIESFAATQEAAPPAESPVQDNLETTPSTPTPADIPTSEPSSLEQLLPPSAPDAPSLTDAAPAPAESTEPSVVPPVASNDQVLSDALDDLTEATATPPPPLLPPSQQPLPADALPATTPPAEPTPEPQQDSSENLPSTPAMQEPSPALEPSPELASNPTAPTEQPAATIVSPAATPPVMPATPPNVSPVPTEPKPTPTAEPVATPPADDTPQSASEQVNVAGKKVIQPLNDITQGPNLDELLAKEAAKEQGVAAGSTSPAVVVSNTPPLPQTDKPDPSSIAL